MATKKTTSTMENYIVLVSFNDGEDNGYHYEKGSKYPRTGFEVSDDRIKLLSGDKNAAGKPVIEVVKEG